MGRYVRKCKGSAKVAVMEKAGAAASRKRKIVIGESELTISSPIQLKTQRLAELRPASSENSTCESGSSGDALASCCSSTVAEENTKFADLKVNEATTAGDLVDLTDRREKSGSSEGESMTAKYRGCSAAEKMRTETELEEFFAAAETNLRRQFIDKYNYDIAKDEALEGRYEWVQVQLKR
ncbi:inhibitor/interactor with cyclin-dependent kinase [Perilla frutescens var. hirtella]|uniref:Inhibitor/interactor with cyclin-dependent kinase n=1 Tax=Perilla frutescens var. hirtella TaxID=608512 RepID=A0AAD4JQF3_PERFH|nr:inhibitor/interactor with cyclin-dependent kinase [Perilla frutescens var. frutescens]KAH6784287.1 inhibitor/interactor with cyclin-dependent kinase [Perilla frutescens var. hirtella]KAH6838093.1 inhibitor/interactor with cyclin-dependent kinase [Perilla frutescens var. hirtella]